MPRRARLSIALAALTAAGAPAARRRVPGDTARYVGAPRRAEPMARPALPPVAYTAKGYRMFADARRRAEGNRAVNGQGRPPWSHPPARGAALLEAADGAYWVIGGFDAAGRPERRTWVFRPEPFERKLRPPERHPGGFWTEGPRMHVARALATVALLGDGRILAAGGVGRDGEVLDAAEVIDPRTGRCHRVNPMHSPRAAAAATRLRSGRVLLAGGYRAEDTPTAHVETFDPRTEDFHAHPWRLPEAVAFPAMARLIDGDVLITGGWNGHGPSDQIALFDDVGGPYRRGHGADRHPGARGGIHRIGALAGPRAGHRMRRFGEVVLIVGGYVEEPCAGAEPADPPEVWDPLRCGGPISDFEPVAPLDDRYPRRLPYLSGREEAYHVSEALPPCAPPPGAPPDPGGYCWIFPRDARDHCDGPWGWWRPPRADPRDRTWPFCVGVRDSRPSVSVPGAAPLPAVRLAPKVP